MDALLEVESGSRESHKIKDLTVGNTILVTDKPDAWAFASKDVPVVNAIDYMLDQAYFAKKSVRIINLCRDYRYQSIGYYVSLLTEARGHKIFPSVMTIQDIKNPALTAILSKSIREEIERSLSSIRSDEFVLSVYFGQNMAKRYEALCRKLHGLFPVPLFQVVFKHNKEWQVKRVTALSIEDIPPAHMDFLAESMRAYFGRKRFHIMKEKTQIYDVAVLVNPEEKNPPSDAEALKKFVKAGEKLGIQLDFITKDDDKTLGEYHGLFIRETTAVNHHTYRMARRALSERMVVIDDPVSILKCTNKVYLAELLQRHHIATPKTYILSKQNYRFLADQIPMPCVLKRPDSAFSHGVIKVSHREEYETKVSEFLKDSDLILAQAFTPTDYDWRIGILDNEPLFACRYYMASGHWQIYDWNSGSKPHGEWDTLSVAEVPREILNTALRAAHLIGDGLYGVDLKEIDGKASVIEVNDNPNIDDDTEALALGDALYQKVIESFLRRIKKSYGHE
ncbi:MAG: 30S ribosomal protein S6--L-glutamate ligase [Gammaproteobacteria bacterium]|nr:30S ribosomal protein S6--L-glutamate ligase [Gammaproteobacteria bacterium]